MRKYLLITGIFLACFLIAAPASAQESAGQKTAPPLDMDGLKNELSLVRGKAKAEGAWPREIRYTFKVYDFKTDSFQQEAKTFVIKKKPHGYAPMGL